MVSRRNSTSCEPLRLPYAWREAGDFQLAGASNVHKLDNVFTWSGVVLVVILVVSLAG